MHTVRAASAAAWAVAILAVNPPARAQADHVRETAAPRDERPPAYRYAPALDLPLTVGLLGSSAALHWTRPERSTPDCYPCSTDGLNPIDQGAVGRGADWAATVSDVGLYASLSAPFLVTLIDAGARDADLGRAAATSAVILESMSAALTLNQLTKRIVQRPRPSVYARSRSEQERVSYGDTLSFYSGHTSLAFAGAVSLGTTYARRHDDPRAEAAVWGVGLGVASMTGIGRVLAGKHFWTDVLVGAATGGAIGWLVPKLHEVEHGGAGADRTPRVEMHVTPMGFGGTF